MLYEEGGRERERIKSVSRGERQECVIGGEIVWDENVGELQNGNR